MTAWREARRLLLWLAYSTAPTARLPTNGTWRGGRALCAEQGERPPRSRRWLRHPTIKWPPPRRPAFTQALVPRSRHQPRSRMARHRHQPLGRRHPPRSPPRRTSTPGDAALGAPSPHPRAPHRRYYRRLPTCLRHRFGPPARCPPRESRRRHWLRKLASVRLQLLTCLWFRRRRLRSRRVLRRRIPVRAAPPAPRSTIAPRPRHPHATSMPPPRHPLDAAPTRAPSLISCQRPKTLTLTLTTDELFCKEQRPRLPPLRNTERERLLGQQWRAIPQVCQCGPLRGLERGPCPRPFSHSWTFPFPFLAD